MDAIPIDNWYLHPEMREHWLTLGDIRNMKIDDEIRLLSPYDRYGYSYCYAPNRKEKSQRPTKMFKDHTIILKRKSGRDFGIQFLLDGGDPFGSVNLCVKIDDDKWEDLYGYRGKTPRYDKYHCSDEERINKLPDFLVVGIDTDLLIKLDKEEYMPNIAI
jgi:hypothetical protein